MTLYIGANKPLTLVNWDENNPKFNMRELDAEIQVVRQRFTKTYVYYVGSHQGCGCGFSYGRYDYEQEEENAARESVRQLREVIDQALASTRSIELYSCWLGDEAEEPTIKDEWKVKYIGGEEFWFQERQLIEVTK